MICKSLYGSLLEQEDESIRQYEATFIAKQSNDHDHLGGANSQRILAKEKITKKLESSV